MAPRVAVRLNTWRIAAWVIGLAVTATATVIAVMPRPLPAVAPQPRDGWIGLPAPTSFNASERGTRHALARAMGMGWNHGDLERSLAYRCGSPEWESAGVAERYIARIGPDVWGPHWIVTMDVKGDLVDVGWKHGSLPPPPENRRDIDLVMPQKRALLPKASLEPVRTAWQARSLWDAPQSTSTFDCKDGHPAQLEACVHGQYLVRARNCDGSADDVVKLWEAFNSVLAPLETPYWIDGDGKRVDPHAAEAL